MSTFLRIMVQMPDTDDPLDLDPEDAADAIIDTYNEERRANGYPQARMMSAEWETFE